MWSTKQEQLKQYVTSFPCGRFVVQTFPLVMIHKISKLMM